MLGASWPYFYLGEKAHVNNKSIIIVEDCYLLGGRYMSSNVLSALHHLP